MSVIETHDLAKSFDNRKAVDGVTMAVEKGELFCLVGPDGAGKSTVIRMLCGIIPPEAGSAAGPAGIGEDAGSGRHGRRLPGRTELK